MKKKVYEVEIYRQITQFRTITIVADAKCPKKYCRTQAEEIGDWLDANDDWKIDYDALPIPKIGTMWEVEDVDPGDSLMIDIDLTHGDPSDD